MQRCFFIFYTKCRKDHNDGKRKKRMRKTLKRNLSYDDRNHLSYVSLYCDGEDGRRVRRTRTYPTMEQAEQVIAEYRRTQLLGGRSAPGDVFVEDWLRCSNGCTATGKGGGSRTLNITPRATSPSTRRESLISRTFCASASRSSSPCRASRRSHSTGCAHSFASVANSQNVPMFSISKALGHSSTSVTSAVYMHLFDDAVADVVSQVASAITGKEQ